MSVYGEGFTMDDPQVPHPSEPPPPSDTTGAAGGVRIALRTVIGRRTLRVQDLLAVESGSVLELDARPGDTVDLVAGTKTVARGTLIDDGGALAVAITAIVGRR